MYEDLDRGVRGRLSRLSAEELAEIAAGTAAGQQRAEVIWTDEERRDRRRRTLRQLASYAVPTIVGALMVFLGTTIGAPIWEDAVRSLMGTDDRPALAQGMSGSYATLLKTDETTWLYLPQPAEVVAVNGVPMHLGQATGWLRLGPGEVHEISITQEGRIVERFTWSANGWRKE